MQVIPHITDEIKSRILRVSSSSDVDIVLVEIGGTVGDIESLPFLEAIRQLRNAARPRQRALPARHARADDRGRGRAEDEAHAALGQRAAPHRYLARRRRLPLVEPAAARAARQDRPLRRPRRARRDRRRGRARTSTRVPLRLREQRLDELVLEHFGLEIDAEPARELGGALPTASTQLEGTRAHRASSASTCSCRTPTCRSSRRSSTARSTTAPHLEIEWVDAETLEPDEAAERAARRRRHPHPRRLRAARDRGQGRGRALRPRVGHAVPRHLPRHAVRGRRVRPQRRAAWRGANSTEFDPDTPYPVVDLLPEQQDVEDMGGTMRLGAEPVELRDGHARARGLRRDARLRAPPPPLRGQQRTCARGSRPPGCASRACSPPRTSSRCIELAGPSVVRRLAVPPRVQVAPDASAAALPRLRRRRGRQRDRRAGGERPPRHEPRRSGPTAPSALFLELAAIASPRGDERAVADRCVAYLRDLGLERARGRRRRPPGDEAGNIILPHPGDGRRERHADLPLRAHRHGASRRRRSSRVVARRRRHERATTRSSAPTTRRPSRRCSTACAGSCAEGRPHAGIELVLTRAGGGRPARRQGVRLLAARTRASATSTTTPAPIGGIVHDGARQYSIDATFHRARGARGHRARRRAAARSPRPRTRIAEMRLGRLDDETTANVGTIARRRRAQHRRRPLHVAAEVRSLRPRARAARSARRCSTRSPTPPTPTSASSRRRRRRSTRAYRLRRTDPGRAARLGGARGAAATRPSCTRPAAAPTPTSSTRAASRASTCRTAWQLIHTPGRAHRRRRRRRHRSTSCWHLSRAPAADVIRPRRWPAD